VLSWESGAMGESKRKPPTRCFLRRAYDPCRGRGCPQPRPLATCPLAIAFRGSRRRRLLPWRSKKKRARRHHVSGRFPCITAALCPSPPRHTTPRQASWLCSRLDFPAGQFLETSLPRAVRPRATQPTISGADGDFGSGFNVVGRATCAMARPAALNRQPVINSPISPLPERADHRATAQSRRPSTRHARACANSNADHGLSGAVRPWAAYACLAGRIGLQGGLTARPDPTFFVFAEGQWRHHGQ